MSMARKTLAETSQTAHALRNLIQVLRNSEKGLAVGEEGLTDSDLKALFRLLAEQRARHADELELELRLEWPEGVEEEAGGDGYLPCAWTEVRSALNREDENGILNKCDQGAELVTQVYEAALEGSLPRRTSALLRRHLIQIKSLRDVLKSLSRND
jgi:uncharacterized protein (TIGR02284 family)